ncbi:MAG TPA: flagellar basal body-associated FliL family protein [bacterium]|nr:flagellar basal body-associated FliL family protein [bacterium]HPN32848.1 flagellar basal body-associated FliL family protein [bacterium]
MAKEKDDIKDEQPEDGQGLPSGKKPLVIKILIIAIVAVVLIGAAIIVSFFVVNKENDGKIKKGDPGAQTADMMKDTINYGQWQLSKGKEPMKFNLQKKDANSAGSPILVADIVLAWNQDEVGSSWFGKKKDPSADLELRRDQIKDIVVNYFNTKTVEEVSLAHANDLKGDLQKYINNVLSDDVARIRNVFFPQYFIQQ